MALGRVYVACLVLAAEELTLTALTHLGAAAQQTGVHKVETRIVGVAGLTGSWLGHTVALAIIHDMACRIDAADCLRLSAGITAAAA